MKDVHFTVFNLYGTQNSCYIRRFVITKFVIDVKFNKDMLSTKLGHFGDFAISVFVINKFYCNTYKEVYEILI